MKYSAQRLAQVRVFNHLPELECLELLKQARYLTFERGQYVVHQGETWPNILFLTAGELRWELLSLGGRTHVLFMVGAGDVFWGHSFFDDEPMPASLIATQTVKAYVWDRETIRPVLSRYPNALWEITKIQVETMRRAREVIYGLAFQPVATRLAGLLLESFREQPEAVSIERDFTLNDMAAMVASSPEVVCRILHQFQANGVLGVTRAHITLHDRATLAQMVETA